MIMRQHEKSGDTTKRKKLYVLACALVDVLKGVVRSEEGAPGRVLGIINAEILKYRDAESKSKYNGTHYK